MLSALPRASKGHGMRAWLEARDIDPQVADDAGVRFCGREFAQALAESHGQTPCADLSTLADLLAPYQRRRIGVVLYPYRLASVLTAVKIATVAPAHPPYNTFGRIEAPFLIDRMEDGAVVICGGEPEALVARSSGLTAVGLPGIWLWRDELTRFFAGRSVSLAIRPPANEQARSHIEKKILSILDVFNAAGQPRPAWRWVAE